MTSPVAKTSPSRRRLRRRSSRGLSPAGRPARPSSAPRPRSTASPRSRGRRRWGEVRVDGQRVHAHVRDAVGPHAGVAQLGRHAGTAVGVGAGVHPAVELLRDQRAVALGPDPHADDRGVTVERHELLRAVEHDLDGPAGFAREGGERRLVPHEGLGAERAAHRRADDPDVLLLDPERARQVGPQVERRLRAGPHRQPAVLPLGDRGVRLDRRVRRAGRPERLLHHDVRLGEAGGDVAVDEAEAVADVRAGQRAHADRDRLAGGLGAVGMQQRGAGRHGVDRVVDGRQLLVGDVDQTGGRARRRGLGAATAATTSPACRATRASTCSSRTWQP